MHFWRPASKPDQKGLTVLHLVVVVVSSVVVAPCQWLSLLLLHGGLPVHFIPHGGVAWLKHQDVSTVLVIMNQKPTPRRVRDDRRLYRAIFTRQPLRAASGGGRTLVVLAS